MKDPSEDKADKYLKSKKHKANVDDFHRKFYLNTNFRNKVRKDYSILQKKSLKMLKMIPDDNDYQTRKVRLLWESILDLAGKYLENCDDGDRMAVERKLLNSKYQLYKSNGTKEVVFKCDFFKVGENKNKTSHLVLLEGISKSRKKGIFVRGEYSLKDHTLLDKGRFSQRYKSLMEVIFVFRGEKTYKIQTIKRGKVKDDLWTKLID